jgi:hypothetical protein
MSERLDPMYEAEIRERIDRLDDDRVLGDSTWLASSVGPKSVLPPEQSHVVEDVLETKSAVIRGSVGVFASKQYAEFTAHARDDVPALLDEVNRLRADLATAKDRLDHLERITLPDLRREIEWHQAGKKRWRDRAKKAEASLADAAVSDSTAGDEQAGTCRCGSQMRCPRGHCSRHDLCQDCGNCCSCQCAGGDR